VRQEQNYTEIRGHRPKGAPAGGRGDLVCFAPGGFLLGSPARTQRRGRMSGSWTRTASPVRGGFKGTGSLGHPGGGTRAGGRERAVARAAAGD